MSAARGSTDQAVLPVGTMADVELEAYLDAAAGAGFDAVSLRPAGVEAWLAAAPGRTPSGLRRLLDRSGLALAELDPVTGWCQRSTWVGGRLPEAVERLLEQAAELGAQAVTALVEPGARWDPTEAVDGLGTLHRAAGDRGVAVQLEPFGWSPLDDLGAADELVAATGRPPGLGVMVDTWHLARRGTPLRVLDSVPVDAVLGVQVADGPAHAAVTDPAVDNRHGRRWPGEGELHPEAIVASLVGRGWRGPVGVEVFGLAGDARQRAQRAWRALDACVGRWPRSQPVPEGGRGAQ